MELTAAQARHIAINNPYDRIKELKKELQRYIEQSANAGQPCAMYRSVRDPLPVEVVDYLVELGYMVYRSKPQPMYTYGVTSIMEYFYTIYWMLPENSEDEFEPGLRWEIEKSGAV